MIEYKLHEGAGPAGAFGALRQDAETVRVWRKSEVTKKVHYADLPFTQAQWDRFMGPGKIQERARHLDADAREFLLTGITPTEWTEIFGKGED